MPCDVESGAELQVQYWPKGEGEFLEVFKGVSPVDGISGLYHPCDRIGLIMHPEWREQVQNRAWNPAIGIFRYVSDLHDLLNSKDYSQANCS